MILEAEGLWVAYEKYAYEVLKDVSFTVEKEQVVSLIGPNGAGKSTALRAIFGILSPKRGKVIFQGEDITGKTPPQILKKGISFVFQESSVFPSMTVYENLEMGAYIETRKDLFKKRLESVYAFFPVLKEKETKYAGTLSGGQRRMLEVGRALLLEPQLLLLDEPSVGLAPKIMKLVFDYIVRINQEEKISIMIVEQNAKQALEISDYVYLLVDGKNRRQGSPQKILADIDIRKLYLGG